MNILHINSYFNGSSFYKNIYDYQTSNGCETIVYCHLPLKNNCFIDYDKCIVARPYVRIDKYFYRIKHKKIVKDLTSSVDFKNITLIHAHSLFSNGYEALKIFKLYGIPYVVSVRNTDINIFFKYCFWLRRIGIEILINASKIIFISQVYLNHTINRIIPSRYKEVVNKKSTVITNGIDDFWLKNRNHHHKNSSIIKVLCVGNVEKNKNQLSTCFALDKIAKKGSKIEFKIIGKINDDYYFNKIKKFKFVDYHEPMSKENLLSEYRKSDIFVMASFTETFGLVYGEAMSQGLPVVYSRGQGFDGQYVDGEVGYSVNSSNVAEIADKIEKCYEYYDYLSTNAEANSIHYEWDDINQKIIKIYKDVLNEF